MLASLILAFTCITTHAAAPKYKYNRRRNNKLDAIKFGVQIGPSVTAIFRETISYPKIENYNITPSNKLIPAFHAGVFGAYKLTDKLDLHVVLLYSRKGNQIVIVGKPMVDHTLPTGRSEKKRNLGYLQATTLINIFPEKSRQFSISLGGYTSYLVLAKEHIDLYVNETKEDTETNNLKEEDIENKPANFDWGLVLGCGYEFEVGLIFNVLMDIGLKNLYKDQKGSINLAGQVSIGYNLAKLLR